MASRNALVGGPTLRKISLCILGLPGASFETESMLELDRPLSSSQYEFGKRPAVKMIKNFCLCRQRLFRIRISLLLIVLLLLVLARHFLCLVVGTLSVVGCIFGGTPGAFCLVLSAAGFASGLWGDKRQNQTSESLAKGHKLIVLFFQKAKASVLFQWARCVALASDHTQKVKTSM